MTGWIKKGLEKRKENLEAKLEKLEQDIKDRTDDVTDFRQMGIDHLFVDESVPYRSVRAGIWGPLSCPVRPSPTA